MSEIKPAMTEEEWAVWRKDGVKHWRGEVLAADERYHACAAVMLDREPFGFTREDVEDCREAGDAATRGDRVLPDSLWTRMNLLADRIEALLPPAAPGEGEGR